MKTIKTMKTIILIVMVMTAMMPLCISMYHPKQGRSSEMVEQALRLGAGYVYMYICKCMYIYCMIYTNSILYTANYIPFTTYFNYLLFLCVDILH